MITARASRWNSRAVAQLVSDWSKYPSDSDTSDSVTRTPLQTAAASEIRVKSFLAHM